MMVREDEIRSMYREIVEYSGDFGDPINTPSFKPWEMIQRSSLTTFERKGVLVAILCHLMTAIDNATYDNAVTGEGARRVRLILRDGQCEDLPLAKQALTAFLQSEAAFCSALEDVYREWVVPEAGA